jgi:peptidyl-prolyl cis-trans isomerase SurA
MKSRLIATAAICLALSIGSDARAQTRELGSSGELLDGVAALVDAGIVLKSELRNRLQVVAENFAQQQAELPPEQRSELPPLSVLEPQVLDQLVVEQALVQRAERIGIEIGDDLLNQVLSEVAASVGVTLETLPSWLAEQGIEYASFREDQRRDLMIRQLERREVIEQIRINPRELEQCLARSQMSEYADFEYNISHILIDFSPDIPEDAEAAQQEIREIAQQLDEGADFAQLAVAYSDSSTALEGGQLGWRKGSELPTIFADYVREMEVGDHSVPIRGAGGFHLVRLNEMRGSEAELVDQVRVRHILITPTEVLDEDATRQRLQGIRDQIAEGDEFGTVAAAVSEDSASAIDGGDIGWATLEDFDQVFAGVIESLDIGELSEPFRSDFGWHIAEVTDRRSYDMTDELRENACRNQIGRAKAVEESELWRRRVHNDAYIDTKI